MEFVSPGFDGVPDRLILFPNGVVSLCGIKGFRKKDETITAEKKKSTGGIRLSCLLHR